MVSSRQCQAVRSSTVVFLPVLSVGKAYLCPSKREAGHSSDQSGFAGVKVTHRSAVYARTHCTVNGESCFASWPVPERERREGLKQRWRGKSLVNCKACSSLQKHIWRELWLFYTIAERWQNVTGVELGGGNLSKAKAMKCIVVDARTVWAWWFVLAGSCGQAAKHALCERRATRACNGLLRHVATRTGLVECTAVL